MANRINKSLEPTKRLSVVWLPSSFYEHGVDEQAALKGWDSAGPELATWYGYRAWAAAQTLPNVLLPGLWYAPACFRNHQKNPLVTANKQQSHKVENII